MKIIDTYHAFAKEMFLEAEVDDDKIIKYKKKDGEQGEMKASSAKTMPKDHPAKIEYDKMAAKGDDSGDKSKGQALGGSDFDRDAQNKKDADAWYDKMFGGHVPSQPKAKEDEPEKDKDDLGPDRGRDDYGKDDLTVPDNEGDWADEMDAVSGEYEEYKGYMEDSKRELEQARAGGDEEEIEDALERFKDDEAEFIKQRDHRKAMIQKAGDEGWLDDYGDEDLEKEYQFQQKLKNRSGKGSGMIGSIGAREKGQGGSGMYDTEKDAYGHSKGDPRYYDPYADAKRRKRAMNASKDYKIINGKKYRPVNEAQNKIADIRKILKTNKGKRIDSIFMDVETAKKVIKHYKSLKGSAKEKFVKQKIQNIVKSVNESKKEEKDFTKLLEENYKRFSRK